VETNAYKTCRRKFCCKFMETTNPYGSTISKLVKKVGIHSILIDRRQLKRNCV
jgi:hypothetical protein